MGFIKALCGLTIIFTGMYLFVYENQTSLEDQQFCYYFYTYIYDETVDEPLMKALMDYCKDKHWN